MTWFDALSGGLSDEPSTLGKSHQVTLVNEMSVKTELEIVEVTVIAGEIERAVTVEISCNLGCMVKAVSMPFRFFLYLPIQCPWGSSGPWRYYGPFVAFHA